MKKLLCLMMLTFAGSLHAAQMNVEVKEQEEKQLSAEEQAAAEKMFQVVKTSSWLNPQQNELRALLQRYPRIIDVKDNYGHTALMEAIYHQNLAIIELLIAADAQLEVQDQNGNTALMHAARDYPSVKRLVAAGAKLDVKNNKGNTARDIAPNDRKERYDEAVAAGLAERKRYLQAQQVAKKELEQHMIPELTKITAEYAYNPAVPEDLPEETKSIKRQV